MKFKTRVAIFLVAVLLSLIGFNLVVTSPDLNLLKAGKTADHKSTSNYLAKAETASLYSASSLGKM